MSSFSRPAEPTSSARTPRLAAENYAALIAVQPGDERPDRVRDDRCQRPDEQHLATAPEETALGHEGSRRADAEERGGREADSGRQPGSVGIGAT